MKKTYQLTGMSCQGCAKNVTTKLSAVVGVKEVQVDFDNSQVTVDGLAPSLLLKSALKGSKYEQG